MLLHELANLNCKTVSEEFPYPKPTLIYSWGTDPRPKNDHHHGDFCLWAIYVTLIKKHWNYIDLSLPEAMLYCLTLYKQTIHESLHFALFFVLPVHAITLYKMISVCVASSDATPSCSLLTISIPLYPHPCLTHFTCSSSSPCS